MLLLCRQTELTLVVGEEHLLGPEVEDEPPLGLYGVLEGVNESYDGRGPAATFPRWYTGDFTTLGLYGGPAGRGGA